MTYFSHLERHDFSVCTSSARDVTSVSTDDLGASCVATLGKVLDEKNQHDTKSNTYVSSNPGVSESGLLLSERDTGDLAVVVLCGERS